MSNFVVLRTQNIKDRGQLNAASRHNATIEGRPANADPKKQQGTYIIAGHEDAAKPLDELIERHNLTIRKSGTVLAVEFVTSFSPESPPADLDKWVDDNLEFFKKKYGEENMLQATLHTDETTPHMHFLIAPVVDKVQYRKERKVLSATDLVGGKKKEAREKLQALHDEYSEAMAHHGLVRGVRNSKATHKTIKQFYGELQKLQFEYQQPEPKQNVKGIKPEKKGLFRNRVKLSTFETMKERFNQLKELYSEFYDKHIKDKKLNKSLQAKVDSLEGLVDKLRFQNHELHKRLDESNVVRLEQENAELKDDLDHAESDLEASQSELKSWRMGYEGQPLTPAMISEYEARKADQDRLDRDIQQDIEDSFRPG